MGNESGLRDGDSYGHFFCRGCQFSRPGRVFLKSACLMYYLALELLQKKKKTYFYAQAKTKSMVDFRPSRKKKKNASRSRSPVGYRLKIYVKKIHDDKKESVCMCVLSHHFEFENYYA